MSELVKRIARLQLIGGDYRAQCYNEGLTAAIHIIEEMEQPTLNENQQVVLEWLQDKFTLTTLTRKSRAGKSRAIGSVYALHDMNRMTDSDYINVWQAYRELNTGEEAQVLRAFSQWVLEQEEE